MGCTQSSETLRCEEAIDKASRLDRRGRYSEAIVGYEEAFELIDDMLPDMHYNSRQFWVQKNERIVRRIAELKNCLDYTSSATHAIIKIEDGSRGHSYESLFLPYLKGIIEHARVVDPWIRKPHQIRNFKDFCCMLYCRCLGLKEITLMTSQDEDEVAIKIQATALESLKADLLRKGITLKVAFMSDIHDREISFSNGYMFDIGRGLDIYYPPESDEKYLEHRRCKGTKIHIYRQQ